MYLLQIFIIKFYILVQNKDENIIPNSNKDIKIKNLKKL